MHDYNVHNQYNLMTADEVEYMKICAKDADANV